MNRTLKSLALVAGLVGLLAACGSDDTSDGATGEHGGDHDQPVDCVPAGDPATADTRVAATLKDFQIALGSPSVANGKVAFDGKNDGQHPHEIVVAKGIAPTELPLADDGTVDEAKLPDGALIGELEAFSSGKSCSAAFDLTPGAYTLFCNVIGAAEGAHAKLGMITPLTVT